METEVVYPNTFLIGAPKCGTTTVDAYLRLHPEVYMSPIKEPNYYASDINIDNFTEFYRRNNTRDLDAYFNAPTLETIHIDFVRSRDQYLKLFESGKGFKCVGEASTSYMYSTVAAEQVSKHHPNAKIIVCLRDPVERLKSHLRMALQLGYISKVDDQLLASDLKAHPSGWGASHLFVELGLFGNQLERWYSRFPKENILIIQFDDLRDRQEKVWSDICAFLNVSIFAPDNIQRENVSQIPRYPLANKVLRKFSGLKNRLPAGVKNAVVRWMSDENGSLDIDESRWRAYFAKDIEHLERVTQMQFDTWKTDRK